MNKILYVAIMRVEIKHILKKFRLKKVGIKGEEIRLFCCIEKIEFFLYNKSYAQKFSKENFACEQRRSV